MVKICMNIWNIQYIQTARKWFKDMINRSLQAIQGRLSPRVLGASFVLLEQRRFRQYWGGGSHDSCCNCSYHPCFYKEWHWILASVVSCGTLPSLQHRQRILCCWWRMDAWLVTLRDLCRDTVFSRSLAGYKRVHGLVELLTSWLSTVYLAPSAQTGTQKHLGLLLRWHCLLHITQMPLNAHLIFQICNPELLPEVG